MVFLTLYVGTFNISYLFKIRVHGLAAFKVSTSQLFRIKNLTPQYLGWSVCCVETNERRRYRFLKSKDQTNSCPISFCRNGFGRNWIQYVEYLYYLKLCKYFFVSFIQVSRDAVFWCYICLGLSAVLSTTFARARRLSRTFFLCFLLPKGATCKLYSDYSGLILVIEFNRVPLGSSPILSSMSQSNSEYAKRRLIAMTSLLLQISLSGLLYLVDCLERILIFVPIQFTWDF